MAKDYYKTLGIAKTADEKEIKTAYRALAKKYHPDLNPGDAKAEETFKLVGEAYDMLSDGNKRAAYDQERAAPKPQPSAARGAASQPGRMGGARDGFFSGGNPNAGGFHSMMDDLLGAGGGRRAAGGVAPGSSAGPARAPSSGEQVLDVTLEEVYHGAKRAHSVSGDEPCPSCKGTGKAQSGRDGLNIGSRCGECRGTGRRARQEETTIVIPAGIADGAKLRLSGRGARAKDGTRGDLLMTVRLKKHDRFERDGNDLTFDLPVPYTVAALGGEVVADVFGLKKTISIPKNTQSGKRLMLKGQGIPGLRDRPAGDLFARLKIVIPGDLSDREQALLRELAQIRKDPIRAA